MTHKLKAIIFDMDGTLANTEEFHRQAFNQAFREYDLPIEWTVQDYVRLLCISGGKERIYQFLKTHKMGPSENRRDYAREIHIRKSEIYREKLFSGEIGLRSGVKRLIKDAQKNKIRMAIATSSSMANVHALLNKTLGDDAIRMFDSVVSCDLIADKKPSPAAYQYVLAELGLAPESCIAIEDTSNGNRAALAAGVKTIVTTHDFTTDNDFSGSSLVLNHLGEPDQPFTVKTGESFGNTFVDIELLKKIVADETYQESNQHWQTDLAVCAK